MDKSLQNKIEELDVDNLRRLVLDMVNALQPLSRGEATSKGYLENVDGIIKRVLSMQDGRRRNEKLLDAAYNGRYDEVIKALENGADINTEDDNDSTPIELAILSSSLEIVKLLILKRAKV